MRAYKVWHDVKHFIHKDTTNDLNVTWTTDILEAKVVNPRSEAIKFFYDELGFSQYTRYDALKLI